MSFVERKVGNSDCDYEDERRSRKNPLNAPAVEVTKGYTASSAVLSKEALRDYKTGYHEKNVDSNEASLRPMQNVVQDHRNDRKSSETLDISSHPAAFCFIQACKSQAACSATS